MGTKREVYIVEIQRDVDTGVPVTETWRRTRSISLGSLHRIDGPARTIRDRLTGEVLDEQWRINGRRSRTASSKKLLRGPPGPT